jgi:hypothetical protein
VCERRPWQSLLRAIQQQVDFAERLRIVFIAPQKKLLDHESSAHYFRAMKNITFSADERVIELAREEARNRKTTLNALFREWMEDLARRDERRQRVAEVYENLAAHITFMPKLTRDEMNER